MAAGTPLGQRTLDPGDLAAERRERSAEAAWPGDEDRIPARGWTRRRRRGSEPALRPVAVDRGADALARDDGDAGFTVAPVIEMDIDVRSMPPAAPREHMADVATTPQSLHDPGLRPHRARAPITP